MGFMLNIKVVLVCSCLFLFMEPAAAARNTKIEVLGALKADLNEVLAATTDLHKACYDRDEQKVAVTLEALVQKIEKAGKKSTMEKRNHPHLVRILNAAKGQLLQSQASNGKSRSKSLSKAFGQLVLLAKVYKLKRYPMFFCSKDKATWLQSGWKAKNPINPVRWGSCGSPIR